MAEAHMFARVVQSGDIVEVYTYKNAIKVGHSRDYEIVRKDGSEIDGTEEKREDNLYRSRQNVRRIIWSNMGQYTKFITLTYAETVLDRETVVKDIKTFVLAMRRRGYDMKYLYVLENQKERGEREGNEGCLHVHMVLFIDEYIPYEVLNQCWKKGSTNINAIDSVRNLGAYVCKYITKDSCRVWGSHVYGVSRGLNRPVEEHMYSDVGGYSDNVYDGIHPNDIVNALDVTFTSTMRYDYRDSDGVGRSQTVVYRQGKWRDGNIIEQRTECPWDDVEEI